MDSHKRIIICLFSLFIISTQPTWAQTAINDIPAEVNADDATITKMGHATMTSGREPVTTPS